MSCPHSRDAHNGRRAATDPTAAQAAPDNLLFSELLAIHALIRQDLAKVTLLAEDASAGADGGEIARRIEALRASSLHWQLKLGCLAHCRFVHGHHSLEDRAILPTLRRVDPEISPAIDRLEAEHRDQLESLLGRMRSWTG